MSKELIDLVAELNKEANTVKSMTQILVAERNGLRDELAAAHAKLAEQQKRINDLEMNLDACASECLGTRQAAKDIASKNQNLFNALMESTKLSDNLYCKGHKLAFVLECILLATDSDMAAISKYWDEAHAALEEWRK